MTDETKKLYEFLDQLKAWHENLRSEVEETKALARAAEKKKHRKRFWRMVLEKDSEAYAINQVFHEFQDKFDLGFKEVETSKVESDTLPGVFYDVIRLENARGEVKFQLKLNGEYCCHPNKDFGETGILNFDEKNTIKLMWALESKPINPLEPPRADKLLAIEDY